MVPTTPHLIEIRVMGGLAEKDSFSWLAGDHGMPEFWSKVSWPRFDGSPYRGPRHEPSSGPFKRYRPLVCHLPSYLRSGTPLHIQAALALAKGWRPSFRGLPPGGITLEPWLGGDAVWRAIRKPGRMRNLWLDSILGYAIGIIQSEIRTIEIKMREYAGIK